MPTGVYRRTNPAWNKGLTKETSSIVASMAISQSESKKINWRDPSYRGKVATQERRDAISDAILEKHKDLEFSARWHKGIIDKAKVYNGSKHHCWQGGKSYEIYPLGWNKTYKEQIRRRDEYKCQVCGKPEVENGRKLHVHHVDYDKCNLDPSNLMSCCTSCHAKTNFNKEKWIEFFKEKVRV